MIKLRSTSLVLGILFFLVVSILALPTNSYAAVSDWHKGVSLYPRFDADFGSESFRASLRNARAAHANYATLIIPIYQSNTGSTDIHRGWNTPTDASLRSGIDFAHSLGMKVVLKPHLESYTGEWRANINPGDRATWFKNYGDLLVHFASLGQEEGVAMFVMGSELINMATRDNPSNTGNWEAMIGRIRGVFSGGLTYSANWGGGYFGDEKNRIDFWGSLDYVGIAAYFPLGSSFVPSVEELRGSWDHWQRTDIGPLAARTGKPVLFTEVGYKSVDGAHYEPWDYNRGGGSNQREQANDYTALFSFWNDYGYMRGIYLWDWETDPNAGGPGTTSYTPQRKEAEGVIKTWFASTGGGGGGTPPPGGTAPFTGTASLSSSSVPVGQGITITARISNTDGPISDILTDIEVYSGGRKVHQYFVGGQTFGDRETKTLSTVWTPGAPGRYTIAVGVFNSAWTRNYLWNGTAATIDVVASGGGGGEGTTPAPGDIDVWWPTDRSTVSGTQPLKVMLTGLPINDYDMYWQVDGDRLNIMADSNEGYPHKEIIIDLSGWTWKGAGPYTLTFTARGKGNTSNLAQRTISIFVAP